MYAGEVVEEGPARDVFAAPSHPYTQELLRSTISLDTTELHSIPGAPPDLVDPPPGCRFHPRCPYAMRVCADVSPPERADGRHRVACWLRSTEGLTVDGSLPLEREEVGIADEA
jgi:oligopeptide/dipeptide ABC transporter ATP-binding protein